MSDPSTLLLLACAGCAEALPGAPAPPPVCEAQVNARSPVLEGEEPSACVSLPERLVAQRGLEQGPTANRVEGAQRRTPPSLRLGDRGAGVVQAQKRLQQLGFYAGALDGVYGSQTRAAVMQFQRSRRLQADGWIGPQTWMALQARAAAALNPTAHSPSNLPPNLPSNLPPRSSVAAPEAFPIALAPSPTPPSTPPAEPTSWTRPTEATDYLWFGVWGVVWGGGWVVILQSEQQKRRSLPRQSGSIPKHRRDFQQALEHAAAPAGNGQPMVMVLRDAVPDPVAAELAAAPPATPIETAPTETAVEQSEGAALAPPPHPAEVASAQEMPIAWAEAHPYSYLRDVLIDLDALDPTRETMVTAIAEAASTPEHPDQEVPGQETPEQETVVATLPDEPAPEGQGYDYALVDDAEGLYVLRGRELRIVHGRLRRCDDHTSVITLRRTDGRGQSVDQSFKLEIRDVRQLIQSNLKTA